MIQLLVLKNFYNPSSKALLINSDEEDDVPEGSNGPVGINEWSPEANKSSSKPR